MSVRECVCVCECLYVCVHASACTDLCACFCTCVCVVCTLEALSVHFNYLFGVILLFFFDSHFEHFQLCLSLADLRVVVGEFVHHLAHAIWSRSLQHSKEEKGLEYARVSSGQWENKCVCVCVCV